MSRKKSRYATLGSDAQSYFDLCDELNSGQKTIIKPYTLSGLMCHLSITRPEFDRLMKTRKYAAILGKAKARIEAFIEENSLTGGLAANASSNSLKYNFGWGEKQVQELDGDVRNIVISLEGDAERLAK